MQTKHNDKFRATHARYIKINARESKHNAFLKYFEEVHILGMTKKESISAPVHQCPCWRKRTSDALCRKAHNEVRWFASGGSIRQIYRTEAK